MNDRPDERTEVALILSQIIDEYERDSVDFSLQNVAPNKILTENIQHVYY